MFLEIWRFKLYTFLGKHEVLNESVQKILLFIRKLETKALCSFGVITKKTQNKANLLFKIKFKKFYITKLSWLRLHSPILPRFPGTPAGPLFDSELTGQDKVTC